jgi:hypothetical protein
MQWYTVVALSFLAYHTVAVNVIGGIAGAYIATPFRTGSGCLCALLCFRNFAAQLEYIYVNVLYA